MSTKLLLLKEFIDVTLCEVAIDPKVASKKGLALLKTQVANSMQFILYNPTFYAQKLEQTLAQAKKYREREIDVDDVMNSDDGIVGFIEIGPTDENCWNALQVNMSAAVKGFGPMMYDIAMSVSKNGLTPDRSVVSSTAGSIWDYYLHRRGDVEAKPFDDVNDPKTPPTEDDCNVHPDRPALNYAYKSSTKIDTKSLEETHQKFLRDFKLRVMGAGLSPIDKLMVNRSLSSLGAYFFTTKAIYPSHFQAINDVRMT